MFESNEWQWLILAAVVVVVLVGRPYLAKRRTYRPIPPEERSQWNTWTCRSCGAENHPEECTEDRRRVRGVCSSCRKPWEGKRQGPYVI